MTAASRRLLPAGQDRAVRRLRGRRRGLRARRPVAAVLRAGARGQAPARVGGPRARARRRARGARDGRCPAPRGAGPGRPAPRPTAPATPAAQQARRRRPRPGVAAPATGAPPRPAASAGHDGAPSPARPAPQNGTGSSAAVPAARRPRSSRGRAGRRARHGEPPRTASAKKPDEAGAAAGRRPSPSRSARSPSPPSPRTSRRSRPRRPPPARAAAAAAAAAAGAAPPRAAAGTPPRRPPPRRRPRRRPRPPGPAARADARRPRCRRARPRAPGRAPTPATAARAGRIAAIVGAVVGVVAVLAVAGILIFGGGGDEPAPKPNTVAQPSRPTPTASGAGRRPARRRPKVNRKAVPLAVLNGTTVTGLARGAADKLTAKGYNEPNVVTNDTTNQARPTTQVFYEAKARAAALDVAQDPRRAHRRRSSRWTPNARGARGPRPGRRLRRGRQGAVAAPPHMTIHLARHGQTAYNHEGRFQGHLPVPLDATGREQAAALAEVAAGVEIVSLVVQPAAPRARDGRHRRPRASASSRVEDARFAETDTGDWTDRSFAEIQRRGPRGLRALRALGPDLPLSRAASRSPSSPTASQAGLADLRARPRGAAGARGLPPRRHPPRARRRASATRPPAGARSPTRRW